MAQKRKPLTHGLTRTEWDTIRERVKARDHYQCVFYPVGCKNGRGTDGRGKGLHVDHIIAWSVSHDNSTFNLRTLCDRHHAILGERETVNPLLVIGQIEEVSALNQVENELKRGFGTLRLIE